MKPGGVLAVSQSHYAAPLQPALRHLWYGWQWEQHVWHFDVPALTRIFVEHGLTRAGVAYNALYYPWIPRPWSWKPKVLAVGVGVAAFSRIEPLFGRDDQFFLAARRTPSS